MVPNLGVREFLRARRAALTPPDVGLPWDMEGRRVRGLRRAEVARLAGISVDYYTRVEQGRADNVSDQVLDAIAGALRLSPVERSHLHTLAHPSDERSALPRRRRVRPSVQAALDAMSSTPACVRDIRMNVLGFNGLWQALFTELGEGSFTNLAKWTFLSDHARDVYPDWERVAREQVGTLQASAARYPADPQLVQLIGELNIASPQFARCWSDRRVFQRTNGTKRIKNEVVGEITLNYDAFEVVTDEQVLVIYTAATGSAAHEQLALLASWAATSPAPNRLDSGPTDELSRFELGKDR
jgi:transcriptional regulator with XRE-family HTH domain